MSIEILILIANWCLVGGGNNSLQTQQIQRLCQLRVIKCVENTSSIRSCLYKESTSELENEDYINIIK
jgi:hypothetical protein